jgi:PPK2 family polyphosphate:nucleotide phosphotransferase
MAVKDGRLHDLRRLAAQLRVPPGTKAVLPGGFDPRHTATFVHKADAEASLQAGVQQLAHYQARLAAQDSYGLLVILQGLDAAGKDGAVKHVMSGVNPQGVRVTSFKVPSAEELNHDFLWRYTRELPARGAIGIFNRSHYEEVLTVRVHKELLERQKLPKQCLTKDIWHQRFKDIRAFERHLARNGTLVLKFFLNVSREEQCKRFLDRIDETAKRWKFSMGDVAERRRWDDYMAAYEDLIRQTSRPEAPWFVVPADHKWFTRLVVAAAMVQAMESLDLKFPKVGGKALKELHKARKALLAERGRR